MIVSLVLTPLPVAAAWVGIHFFDLGLIWCWIVITLWVCSSGRDLRGPLPARPLAAHARDRAGIS